MQFQFHWQFQLLSGYYLLLTGVCHRLPNSTQVHLSLIYVLDEQSSVYHIYNFWMVVGGWSSKGCLSIQQCHSYVGALGNLSHVCTRRTAPGVPFGSSPLRLRKQTLPGSSGVDSEVGSVGWLGTPPAYIWLLIGCLSWSEHRWRGLRLRFQRRCQLSLLCSCFLLFAASAGFLESLQHRRHVSGWVWQSCWGS